ncbi:envelope biogenesis factor ElyC [Aliivibrio fischeri]|uniref:Conserved inner membrane protein n=5 Tax=Aliivibrio fischeri TaxID=668 RepID=Q5E0E8_ALIF1|nr:envelope biogenesis factor ElyC [Aliivibrio fischeri]AAW87498.1 conserved inner membrane protein [Aliivibrio fischeri ES114]ACH64197.1 integral membrane protein [Aliivibrio fischeri MJ11]EHN68537.1 integral membrane protein [Aliivibrio fischeri SR5]KLU78333.1 membrane protein [Aliivibrio fischeri]MBP3139204.1 envelope biogenesis factor ElyC [Aliivibrio fischeri]
MFELKKFLSSMLMPLPGFLLIGFIGLLILWFSKRKGFASFLLTLSLLGIFLLSFQPITTPLLKSTERIYPSFIAPETPVEYVLVLGNGHVVDDEISPISELSRAAVMRLTEGIRIYRMYPGSKMILSGYNGGTTVSHARMMARVALSLGVQKSDILLLESARDTHEEAIQTFNSVGKSTLVLVTSASHMPRAMSEFHQLGMDPVPAPTNYLAHSEVKQPWDKYAPKAKYLEQSERFWYEQMGRWFMQLKDLVMKKEQQAQETPKLEIEDVMEKVDELKDSLPLSDEK